MPNFIGKGSLNLNDLDLLRNVWVSKLKDETNSRRMKSSRVCAENAKAVRRSSARSAPTKPVVDVWGR